MKDLKQRFQQVSAQIKAHEATREHEACKSWQKAYRPLYKYVQENFYNTNRNNFTLERLEQLHRNISEWINPLKGIERDPKDPISVNESDQAAAAAEWLQAAVNDIQSRIEWMKQERQQPTKTATAAGTLADIITHEKAAEIVEAMKDEFKGIGGKSLKCLLAAMTEVGLLPESPNASKFHRLFKKTFDWNVKSYPAMNDYLIIEADRKHINSNIERLQRIINNV